MASSDPPHYFEDFDVGETFEFGSYTATEEEIIEFAERYDPQPFHVDENAAQNSIFGELIASGWHTAAICQRILVDGIITDMASAGGRGVDELRWHKPVRPGDTLSLQMEIIDKHSSDGDSGLGHINAKLTGFNQNDDPVISWVLLGMIERQRSTR